MHVAMAILNEFDPPTFPITKLHNDSRVVSEVFGKVLKSPYSTF